MFRPATNNYKDSRVETALKNVSRLFGHSNMMLDENLLPVRAYEFKSRQEYQYKTEADTGPEYIYY